HFLLIFFDDFFSASDLSSFSFSLSLILRYLHSFPTRRSSDLYEYLRSHRQEFLLLHTRTEEKAALSEEAPFCSLLQIYVLPSYRDRKSTRLNSSHVSISYAVFCLKKKKNNAEKYLL